MEMIWCRDLFQLLAHLASLVTKKVPKAKHVQSLLDLTYNKPNQDFVVSTLVHHRNTAICLSFAQFLLDRRLSQPRWNVSLFGSIRRCFACLTPTHSAS